MTQTDRRYGVAEGTAVKAPCRAATTANITLAGAQTIDGVAVVAGDRVLVKDQSTASQNGIYLVSTGNWTRDKDFDGAYDVVQGTRVWVNSGSVNGAAEFVVTTSGTITIDSTSIAISNLLTLLNAAPGNVDYIVKTASAVLSAERVATDATPVSWDFSTPAQAKIVVAAASAIASGIVELATSAEAITGTDTVRAVTPAGLAATISAVSPAFPRGYIDGCGIANNASDATNDIDFSAGVCRDSTNVFNITCLAKTKQLDVTFSAGTAAGMRSASSLSNTWWHLFAIAKADGTSDYLAHDAVNPTSVLPSGYLYFRHIGSIVRVSAAILAFTQLEDDFLWAAQVVDVNVSNPGTSAVARVLTVPTGIKVLADITVTNDDASTSNQLLVTAMDQTDTAPTATACTINISGGANYVGNAQMKLRTDTSGQVRTRNSASGASNSLKILTNGFRHPRGRNA